MSFRVLGLSPAPFRPLFDLSDRQLLEVGARRVVADDPHMPCRVSLDEAVIGEEVLLLNFEHQPANTPYRARHAIFVRRSADTAFDGVDVVPQTLATRLLSLRAFDADHMMVDAEVVEGTQAAEMFERFLADPAVSYLQAHHARRGCYAARVERA